MYLRSRGRFIALIIALIIGIGQSASSAAIPHTVTSARTWTELLSLTSSDGAAGDVFGASVALDGDTIVVGSPATDINDQLNQGAAYVYRWNGTSWAETKLIASDGAANDLFGWSVALDGDTLVVGAYATDVNSNQNQGAAYVYRWNGASWVETKLTASDGAASDNFGYTVALAGDTLVVSSHLADVNTNQDQGAAYVYRWDGASWVESKLIASDGVAFDNFGYSVTLQGDTLVVGAPGATINGVTSQGAAYVYRWNDASWVETKLTASDGVAYDLFGRSVALDLNTLVIGASEANINDNADQGAAYIYSWDGTIWFETKLTASDAAPTDRFGENVVIDGLSVVIGAKWNDINANNDAGAVYVFSGNQAPTVALDSQAVTTLASVTLTATASDPDNDALSFNWSQTAGTPVTLTNPLSLTTNFTAPDDPTTLVFELQVTDAYSATTTGTVTVTVENQAPLVDVGLDQTVATFASVTLPGTANDPDHDALSFNWIQTAGTPVTLTSPLSITTDFTAPDDPTTLVFELQVTDAYSATSTGTVTVTVENQAPNAVAGPNQTVAVFETVTLSGTASSDPDDDALSYAWTQVSGIPVTLTNPLSATTTFVASTPGIVTFELRVTDAFDAVSTDTIEVTVTGYQVFLPLLTKGTSASHRIQR